MIFILCGNYSAIHVQNYHSFSPLESSYYLGRGRYEKKGETIPPPKSEKATPEAKKPKPTKKKARKKGKKKAPTSLVKLRSLALEWFREMIFVFPNTWQSYTQDELRERALEALAAEKGDEVKTLLQAWERFTTLVSEDEKASHLDLAIVAFIDKDYALSSRRGGLHFDSITENALDLGKLSMKDRQELHKAFLHVSYCANSLYNHAYARDTAQQALYFSNPKKAPLAEAQNIYLLAKADLFMGHIKRARILLHDTAKKLKKTLGKEHRYTITVNAALASSYTQIKEQNYKRAKSILRKQISLSQKHFGEKHPMTLALQDNLGTIILDQKKASEARPFIEKAYKSRKEILGEKHPDTLLSAYHLANLEAHLIPLRNNSWVRGNGFRREGEVL